MAMTYREEVGRSLTYKEADDNFRFVEEKADLLSMSASEAKGYRDTAKQHKVDASGSATQAQGSSDEAQDLLQQTQGLYDRTATASQEAQDAAANAVAIVYGDALGDLQAILDDITGA